MNIVCLETPYAGDVDRNVRYARFCLKDCLYRGEAPIASHLLYTQVLDDTVPIERTIGIEAGLALAEKADKTVVYTDYGISKGMQYGIERAKSSGRTVEFRSLYGN